MKSTKVKNNALLKEFQEDIDDNELQERFNGFQRDLQNNTERYNKADKFVKDLERRQIQMADDIASRIEYKEPYERLLKEFTDIHKEKKSFEQIICNTAPEIHRLQGLINLYKIGSENKWHMWWKVLKAAGITYLSLPEWKKEYDTTKII